MGAELRAAARLAVRLQDAVLRDQGVTVSVGVGRTRLLARLLSPLHKPAGVSVLPDTCRVAFMAAQPIARIPQLRGKAGAEVCAALGAVTVGDLARFSEADLAARFPAKQAAYLASLPHGGHAGEVAERGPPKSLLVEQSFQAVGNAAALAALIRPLAATLLLRTVRHLIQLVCTSALLTVRHGGIGEYAGTGNGHMMKRTLRVQSEDTAAHARLPAKLVATWRHQHEAVRSKGAPFPHKARVALEAALPSRAPGSQDADGVAADAKAAAEETLVTTAMALVRLVAP